MNLAPLLFRRSLANAFLSSTRPHNAPKTLLNSFLLRGVVRSTHRFSLSLPRTHASQATTGLCPPRASSILKFIPHNVWQATHRSRIAQVGRVRDPFGGGPPPPKGFWQKLRQWIDSLPSGFILWGIMGLNVLVFISWSAAVANAHQGNHKLYRQMMENFTLSMRNIKDGRYWALLTSTISHENIPHILFNGMTYYFMAPPVLAILGNVGFLTLYLGGGLIANLTSLYWHSNIHREPNYSSHGASGAIYSIISFWACIAPTSQFLIFGIVPLPAWVFVAGIFAWDSYSSVTGQHGKVDTVNHVGGLLAGMAFFLRWRFFRS